MGQHNIKMLSSILVLYMSSSNFVELSTAIQVASKATPSVVLGNSRMAEVKSQNLATA